MKTRIILLLSICFLLSLSCNKKTADEEMAKIAKVSPIIGEWHLVKYFGVLGQFEFEKGERVWIFDESNVIVIDTATSDIDTLSYSIFESNGYEYIKLSKYELGRITIGEDHFNVNEYLRSNGGSAPFISGISYFEK